MLPKTSRLIVGLIGTGLLCVFVIGLAHSISTGFAGFWGGFPFWIIALTVLAMAVFDFFDECVRRK